MQKEIETHKNNKVAFDYKFLRDMQKSEFWLKNVGNCEKCNFFANTTQTVNNKIT